MRRIVQTVLLLVTALSAIACGAPEARRDGPTTRDRANESFQDLEREESKRGGGN
jgi:hypothetical protein